MWKKQARLLREEIGGLEAGFEGEAEVEAEEEGVKRKPEISSASLTEGENADVVRLSVNLPSETKSK